MAGPSVRRALIPAALVGCVIWSFWPTLVALVGRWGDDSRYSHAFLVAPFAAFYLWRRRAALRREAAPASWWGVALVAAGASVHLLGAVVHMAWLGAFGLLPALAGLAVVLGGWPALRRSWPAIGFLVFMIPLPYRAEAVLGDPLQTLATRVSTYALQTAGLPAVAEGHVVVVGEARIGVLEACSGLGMLVSFFCLATGVVMMIRRPWWQAACVLLSAAPIAVAANVARVALAAWLHVTLGGKVAEFVYHDAAGWLMMPLALALLALELWYLSRLFLAVDDADPVASFLARSRPGPSPSTRLVEGRGLPSEA